MVLISWSVTCAATWRLQMRSFEDRWMDWLIYGGEMPPLLENMPEVPMPIGYPFEEANDG